MRNLLIILSVFFVFNVAAAQETAIDYDKIPASVQKFVKTDFPKAKISKTTVQKNGPETFYSVYFDDGRFLRFGGQGKWREKSFENDAEKRTLSAKHMPANIAKYIEDNYKGNPAVVIKKYKNGSFDVKLKDGKLLKFDAKFKFLGEGKAE